MDINTKLIHGYPVFDKETGASSVPVYQASTFCQPSLSSKQEFTYSRFNNPTRLALEKAVSAIEGNAKYGFAFSSGMAAISAVLLNFAHGDHLVMCKSIYGGTFSLATNSLKRFGIEVTFVDETNLDAWENAIQGNTKAFYLETPSNPLLKVTDIQAVTNIAKKHNLVSIIDNTFMTPVFQTPFRFGVDIVIQSATKFLNGHSDVVAGLVMVNSEELATKIKKLQIDLGGILGPEDSWLVMRGLKTMGLRMTQSAKSAQKIAEFLEQHPKVLKVNYPGLKSHSCHKIHMQQATSGGAVLSFELDSRNSVDVFLNHVQIPILAVSLGGVESILSYPVTMSHACVSVENRLKQGITDGLLRLSVGIEDEVDLLEDLGQALNFL